MLYNSFILEKVNHITVLYSRKSMSNLYYSKTILLFLNNLVNFFFCCYNFIKKIKTHTSISICF